MVDAPAEIASARVVSAPFCGLSMVDASDGYPPTYFAIIAVEGGQLPVEVSPGALFLIASIVTAPHESTLVLSRKSENDLFECGGVFSAGAAENVARGLSG
jgi:hypothetical protein